MKTKVLKISPDSFNQKDLEIVASIVGQGGVVSFPTDTVYGLGADAFNREAVEKMFAIKKRPFDKPLVIFVAKPEELKPFKVNLTPVANKIIDSFWPGKLTLIIPSEATNLKGIVKEGTIGVRIPNHQISLELLKMLDTSLVTTSANLSGNPSLDSAEAVINELAGKIDVLLDGGATGSKEVSTVLDVTVSPPVLVRQGALPFNEIKQCLENSGLSF